MNFYRFIIVLFMILDGYAFWHSSFKLPDKQEERVIFLFHSLVAEGLGEVSQAASEVLVSYFA